MMSTRVMMIFYLIILHYQISTKSFSHAAPSTILLQAQDFKDGNTLGSPSGVFKLWFFSPGPLKSRYLGISFNTGAHLHPIWIANRGTPIFDASGVLTIDPHGVLKLGNSQRVLIDFNPNQPARSTNNSVTATLLDNGNFVLTERDFITGEERLLWQSFDFPTHALLPGMRLSINTKTGQSKSLTSWLSDGVPASGAFTLGLNPASNTSELFIQRRGITYWKSGAWTGHSFSLAAHLAASGTQFSNNPYSFSFNVSSEDQKYFTYSGKTNSTVLVWEMTPLGELLGYEITTKDFRFTGSHKLIQCNFVRDGDGEGDGHGCERWELPSCRSGRDRFQQKRGKMETDAFPQISPVAMNTSVGASDCEEICIRNCSCVAFAILSAVDHTGCNFWFKGSRLVEDQKVGFLFYLSPSHPEKKWWMWFLITVAAASALFLTASLSYLRWKRIIPFENSNRRWNTSPEKLLIQLRTTTSSVANGQCPDFQLFSFDSILSATNNFSSTNKLGEGGFGPVYKGKLLGGRDIAVKRLSRSSGQGLEEFKNEIVLIAKLQHTNLVRLLGCCIHEEERMLIYEYMPNKSLDSLIFDTVGREALDWEKRLNIIEGTAQGLLYLHKYSRLKVIHRDLKPSNILLDADLNPKISDFGTARIFGQNDSNSTKRIIGTYGYMSPEYAMGGIFSEKSDVFSFGVLLLEIVSGRKNTSFNQFDSHLNLIGYAWDLWQRNAVTELMDPLLATSCPNINSIVGCIHVGLLCVQEKAVDRPTMLKVVSMFANEAMVLPSPKQAAFSMGENLMELHMSREELELCSHNSITVSTLSAR